MSDPLPNAKVFLPPPLRNNNQTAPPPSYPEMLKSVKKAKKDGRDTFEYFLRSAVGSGAYRLGRVIECRENVAGMTLIFVCMALIKYRERKQLEGEGDLLKEMLRNHLEELKVMRTSVSVPLCVIPEEEGVMFPGEGMSLRFLNALLILESLLLTRMTGETGIMQESWSLYSPLDLVINMELPSLLGVLTDSEKLRYAEAINMRRDGYGYEEEGKRAAALILATRELKDGKVKGKGEGDSSSASSSSTMKVLALIFMIFYTIVVIKLSS